MAYYYIRCLHWEFSNFYCGGETGEHFRLDVDSIGNRYFNTTPEETGDPCLSVIIVSEVFKLPG